jgi:ribosome-binding factor A
VLRGRRSGAGPVARAVGVSGAGKRAGAAAAEHGRSQRQLRVGEGLRHALVQILREGRCHHPALENASITITEVRVSPDLRNATAFVMPLAGTNAPEIMAGLERSVMFLKGLLAREVRLRNTPNLAFELDASFDQAARISALLARPEVARDLQPPAVQSENTEDDG